MANFPPSSYDAKLAGFGLDFALDENITQLAQRILGPKKTTAVNGGNDPLLLEKKTKILVDTGGFRKNPTKLYIKYKNIFQYGY